MTGLAHADSTWTVIYIILRQCKVGEAAVKCLLLLICEAGFKKNRATATFEHKWLISLKKPYFPLEGQSKHYALHKKKVWAGGLVLGNPQ